MNVSLKSLVLKDILIYYFINLSFYIVEIISFILLYPIWPFDVFWLNASLRGLLSLFFAITVRNTVLKETKNFGIYVPKIIGLRKSF